MPTNNCLKFDLETTEKSLNIFREITIQPETGICYFLIAIKLECYLVWEFTLKIK